MTDAVDLRLLRIEADGAVATARPEVIDAAAEIVAATVDLYARRGYVEPWTGYLAVDAHDAWLGSCGFAGPPHDGEVEIAYFTVPEHRGRGVASSMARALIDSTREDVRASGCCFIAHTLPVESASTTILARLGFENLGEIDHPEDGAVWKWRRQP